MCSDQMPPEGCHTGPAVQVVVRIRPPLPRELNGDRRFQNISRVEVLPAAQRGAWFFGVWIAKLGQELQPLTPCR